MDLFTESEVAESNTVVAVPTRELPDEVAAVCRAWLGYKEAVDVFQNRVAELRKAECQERGLDEEESSWELVLYRHETEHDPKEIRDRTKSLLARIASSTFAPRGARLDIAAPDADECPAVAPENFDPVALWWYFADKYSGDAGAKRAYRSAAKDFGYALSIQRGMEPKMIGGRFALDCPVYGDFGSWAGSSTETTLANVLRGIAAIGEWAGIWNIRHIADTRAVQNAFTEGARYNGPKPDRMAIGDCVLIVPFKCKVEWRFSPEFAEKIQLFLEEHDGFYTGRY